MVPVSDLVRAAFVEGVLQRQQRLDISIVRRELSWLLETKDDNGSSLIRLENLLKKHMHV